MKNSRKVLCLVMAVLFCMTMAITVSASSNSRGAGIYGTISGSIRQNGGNLITSTTITKNPDSAYLAVRIQLSDGTVYTAATYSESSRDVTSYPYTWPMRYAYDQLPVCAFCTHGVQGGNQSGSAYAVYTSVSLDTSFFN